MNRKVLYRCVGVSVLLLSVVGMCIGVLSQAAITNEKSMPANVKAGQRSLTLTPAQIDSIERRFGSSVVIIPEYRTQIFTALAHYPDLVGVEISFEYSEEATTMASRPKVASLFSGKRHYRILVNNKQDFEGILLKDVPAEAQVGIIGHEIAHIAMYESRNWLGMVQIGAMFIDDEGKRALERATDKHTIERGLGWQLLEWAKFSMYDSAKASESYKAFKRRTYMNPDEIMQSMKQYSCYD